MASGRAARQRHLPKIEARGRARNSRADAKSSGRRPAKRSSNSSDSRTDTSSSTTEMSGRITSTVSLRRASHPSKQAPELRQYWRHPLHPRMREE